MLRYHASMKSMTQPCHKCSTNDYGFIFTEKSVTVAQGALAILQIFFMWLDSSNISAMSYISVQVFECMYGCQFCIIPGATAPFLTKQFASPPFCAHSLHHWMSPPTQTS